MNEQRSLKSLEFFVILVELTRFACLLFERSFALFELSKDIVDADEVLLGAVELPLSLSYKLPGTLQLSKLYYRTFITVLQGEM